MSLSKTQIDSLKTAGADLAKKHGYPEGQRKKFVEDFVEVMSTLEVDITVLLEDMDTNITPLVEAIHPFHPITTAHVVQHHRETVRNLASEVVTTLLQVKHGSLRLELLDTYATLVQEVRKALVEANSRDLSRTRAD